MVPQNQQQAHRETDRKTQQGAQKRTMAQALNLALTQEMERDDGVIVLGEDVGVDGGVFRVTEGLLDKYGEQRVMDTPLAEAAIVGVSIGMGSKVSSTQNDFAQGAFQLTGNQLDVAIQGTGFLAATSTATARARTAPRTTSWSQFSRPV